ncbi:MAG TPA: hypothetical protein VK116_07855, partial [Planctomycetota bacterium]|nr:hypothetical protein [Planctomycetota bacterium]
RGQSYPAITSPDDTLTTVCPVLENEATFRVDVLDPEAVRESFHGDRFRWMLSAPPGTSETEVELGLFLASKFDGLGVAGWSASIEIDDAFEILGATVADTAGDLDARGFDGFELTEIVDPNENGGRSGVVSAVILCLSECDTTLPAVGEELVLRVHGTIDTSSIMEEGQELGPIAIQPTESNEIGLEGSGEPVKTVASQSGISVPADVIGAELVVVATTPPIPFIRGEANDDSSRDIGDVVFLLNYLFQNGPELLCEKAADSNDDGTLDLSDSIHLLLFLFRGGLAPTAPFPDCGTDPTPDSLTCFARLGACGP